MFNNNDDDKKSIICTYCISRIVCFDTIKSAISFDSMEFN